MDEYICDDREDINVLAEKIERMSDEEFEQFVEKMKENEHRSFVNTQKREPFFKF